MKKILSLLFVTAILFTACEGDQGPPGPPGFDGNNGANGADGDIIASSAFERVVDFTAANNYQFQEDYGFEVLASDVTLVYILWETNNDQDVWRLLPQTVSFDDGSDLVYNFDFTQTNVRYFLEGSTDFAALDPSYTQEQVFRVVVVPADNIDGMDLSDLGAIMQANNIESFEMK